MKDYSRFPTMKDMAYWIVILILFILGSFTYYYGSDKDLTSHISFGGTLVSILLALIAIIYSFYQSSTYENATHKLNTSAKKIKKATEKLSNVSEIETLMNEFKGEVKIINNSISEVKLIIDKVDVGINSMKEKIEESTIFQQDSNTQKDFVEEYNEDYFLKLLRNTSQLTLFLLIVINKFSNVDIELRDWTKIYYNHIEDKTYPNESLVKKYIYVQVGVLAAYSQLGFFDVEQIENSESLFKVTNINENLNQAINKMEERLIENKNEKFTKVINIMEKFKS